MVQNKQESGWSTGPFTHSFARLLTPITLSFAPPCSLCSAALTHELMGKWIIECLSTSLFWTIVQRGGEKKMLSLSGEPRDIRVHIPGWIFLCKVEREKGRIKSLRGNGKPLEFLNGEKIVPLKSNQWLDSAHCIGFAFLPFLTPRKPQSKLKLFLLPPFSNKEWFSDLHS